MELGKLFETQKILRDRINYNEPDRFNKLILALLVELGECANEWRGFKFWSKNQGPRTVIETGSCLYCAGTGNKFYDEIDETEEAWEDCEYCHGEGEELKFPLLEEYVDGLHFVLELGLEIDYHSMGYNKNHKQKEKTITEQFCLVMHHSNMMTEDDYFAELLHSFIHLGEMLGFSWGQIEQAYFEKNEVNHQRQNNGY